MPPNLELNTRNGAISTTIVTVGTPDSQVFDGEVVLTADAHAPFAVPPLAGQDIDALYGRGLNAGGGVIGEGGDGGAGVVGIAGSTSTFGSDHGALRPPSLGRGVTSGVLGSGPVGVEGRGGITGVLGSGPVGVDGRSPSIAVLATSAAGTAVLATSLTGTAVLARVRRFRRDVFVGGPNLAGHFVGPVVVEGSLVVVGPKSAAVPHADGYSRLLYSIESPESWFEDFGEAKLVKGKAQVNLDRDFAAVIKTRGYHVFITPYGNSNGLYVSRRNGVGFTVHEQNRGTSNLSFAYRVVARRKDVPSARMPKVKLPVAAEPPSQPKANSTRRKGT